MNNDSKNGCGTVLIGIIIVAVVIFIGSQLFGIGNNTEAPASVPEDSGSAQSVDDGIYLGPAVIAEQLDRDGCPVQTTSNLINAEFFYVVAPNSEIPVGTDVFVRLYHNGIAVEDLPLITANQNYESTCINFVAETTDGSDFEAGNYEAEFWVNGNSYSSVNFEIN